MPDYKFTNHAMTRMSQRAVGSEDIELVFNYGTQIGPNEWLIRRKDANREIADLKRKIQRIERLKNKNLKVVAEGDTVITCYPSSRVDQRRTFRRGRAA